MSVSEAAALSEARLRAALSTIERPLLRERSVKATADGLCQGRYLVSFPRSALGPGPSRVLRGICARLGAPETGIAALDRHQAAAVSVHFGYEPNPAGDVLKCYLEFPPDRQPAPDLVFLALKWRQDGANVLSRYRTCDRLLAPAQHALMDEILAAGPVREAMHALMDLSPPCAGLRLLVVDEPGSPRCSIDLNLSERRQTLSDQRALLARLLGGDAAVLAYLDAHEADRLGHVAAGTGRDGRPFATLYHGAHRVYGDL